ncbi:hypothetical protein IA539_08220 [Gordonia sp. zg691]|uniref:Uncharacterized protein n=1 Tax=Gordonia jinghuaiqii TaxID=2758710 RepID=A0A7D7M0W5_9ACTN|nr:hypothetical protein [Gordonia jinghuaiqii]MBD0861198.1 hypothetical protein [Gordonia jinghuaiqii]QMT03356.1 hypothetical protein H1R19_09820 [Gordonia jinghuaiqii]
MTTLADGHRVPCPPAVVSTGPGTDYADSGQSQQGKQDEQAQRDIVIVELWELFA